MRRKHIIRVKLLICLVILQVFVSFKYVVFIFIEIHNCNLVAFTPEDQSLFIANTDERVG